MDIKIDYVQLPADASLRPVSGNPYPSYWKLIKNNLEEKQIPSKQCISAYMFSIYTYPLLDLAQQLTGLTAAPFCLIKGDLFL